MSATILERTRQGLPLIDLDIIDTHGHVGPFRFSQSDTTTQSLVVGMDRLGVRTILCSHTACLRGDIERGNDALLADMRLFPGRIAGYLTVWPGSAARVQAEVSRMADKGFVGLKMHDFNGFAYTDDAYKPVMEYANEHRWLVLMHTWGGEHEFKEVAKLSRLYPETSLIMAHATALKEDDYINAARELPNVYLDICTGLSRRGIVEKLIQGAGIHKILWASDALFISMAHQLGHIIGTDISEAGKLALLSTNAKRLLARVR